MKIALVGASGTGKTRLAGELAARLQTQGRDTTVVPDMLRQWCARQGRAPRPDEHLPIAREQERRVDEATRCSDVVIADTTALMVAVGGGKLFEDAELHRFALARQRRYDLTLLMGLDLAWAADGLQLGGVHEREPVDALIRTVLGESGVPYRVVYGQGTQRVANALAAIDSAATGSRPAAPRQRWHWNCEKCSDPQCERRLFGASGLPLPR